MSSGGQHLPEGGRRPSGQGRFHHPGGIKKSNDRGGVFGGEGLQISAHQFFLPGHGLDLCGSGSRILADRADPLQGVEVHTPRPQANATIPTNFSGD
jgi:hypothetical protein